jgi:hypothetical protein
MITDCLGNKEEWNMKEIMTDNEHRSEHEQSQYQNHAQSGQLAGRKKSLHIDTM